MAIDDSLVSAEQKVIGDVKTVFLSTYQEQKPMHKMIIIVVVLVVAALILWFIGRMVVGFMHTPMGMLLIGITVMALISYLFLRSKGVGFKSWTGGAVEILMIVMFLVVYIGLLDTITGVVLMLAPILIFGGVAYIGYKWYKSTSDKYTAQGIIAMVIAFCVAVPIYQAVIVPYTVGTPVELVVDVTRDSLGDWKAHVEMHPFHVATTMTTQFNPYLMGAVELSHWMWTEANTVEKAYVDINIQIESTREVIYYETGHVIYVGMNDMETIWGAVHIPSEYLQYINVQIRITAQVYNDDGVLTSASGIYTQ